MDKLRMSTLDSLSRLSQLLGATTTMRPWARWFNTSKAFLEFEEWVVEDRGKIERAIGGAGGSRQGWELCIRRPAWSSPAIATISVIPSCSAWKEATFKYWDWPGPYRPQTGLYWPNTGLYWPNTASLILDIIPSPNTQFNTSHSTMLDRILNITTGELNYQK